MAKPIFQDIVPPERRSIKKLTRPVPPPPESPELYQEEMISTRRSAPLRKETRRAIEEFEEKEEAFIRPPSGDLSLDEDAPSRPPVYQAPKKGTSLTKIGFTLIALLIIFGAGFFFISRVTGAHVTVTPKEEAVSVDAQFNAVRTGEGLQFQTVTIAKDGKLAIAATEQEIANVKASGTIVIYNTTAAAQKLVANTRFETPTGLIFRVSQPVTVPARSMQAGASVPGSVEAIVTADANGPEYNVGLVDFTIPGFKGDPKFTQIYARAKVPMQGGFSGTRKKVDPKELETAREKVRSELKSTLVREAEKNIPTGFVLPTDAYYIQYESLVDTQIETGVQINERATFRGFIFNRTQLATEISKKVHNSNATDVLPTDISSIDTLVFKIKDSSIKEPWNSPSIAFTLIGQTKLVSIIDQEKVKGDLAGKPRNSLNAILAGYPAVSKAEVTMRPFWKKTFPTNTAEITVTVAEAQLSTQ
ncbi:MAG: hypothetical protein V4519_03035 [Patescibacteria group bacterium]